MTDVLVDESRYEEEIKKSRFIAIANYADRVEQAFMFIEERSDPQARHNCWAYKIGDQYRFSDDGEPGGTAGRPILQAIEGQDVDHVVVLVIRWFGGIKLGTGGLIRAYGGVAAECLRIARKKRYVKTIPVVCFCPYADIDRVQFGFQDLQIRVEAQDYGSEGVTWTLQIQQELLDDFSQILANLTRGQGWVKSSTHDDLLP